MHKPYKGRIGKKLDSCVKQGLGFFYNLSLGRQPGHFYLVSFLFPSPPIKNAPSKTKCFFSSDPEFFPFSDWFIHIFIKLYIIVDNI